MSKQGTRINTFIAGVVLLGTIALPSGGLAAESLTLEQRIRKYFDTCFADLKAVADKQPDVDSFRKAMKPMADKTAGYFGGTLIDPDFVIQEVYYKRDWLARGYDLKKVDQLVAFAKAMKLKPAPQLSEPGHGNLVQPRLVAMRYPVIKDGKLTAIVSVMIRTEAFLEAVGLDKVRAFEIWCQGKLAESSGTLSANPQKFVMDLPSNQWEIRFDEGK